MIAALRPWKESLPPGPVLEVGCGTGFITRGLAELFPGRELEITDVSEAMVHHCRREFSDYSNIRCYPLNAEGFLPDEPQYALTVAGFVAQWFRNPALTLGKLLEATRPGGLQLISFPGSESFPEWKQSCRETGLPFTGNKLPDTEEMVIKMSTGPVQVDYYEDTVTQTFQGAAEFFRHLKAIGAGAQLSGRHLSPKELKLLIDHWDRKTEGQCTVSYHVVFMAVKRDYNS